MVLVEVEELKLREAMLLLFRGTWIGDSEGVVEWGVVDNEDLRGSILSVFKLTEGDRGKAGSLESRHNMLFLVLLFV